MRQARRSKARCAASLLLGLTLSCAAPAVNAETITYTYDALGRLRTASSTAGWQVGYRFDHTGNRIKYSTGAATGSVMYFQKTDGTVASWIVSGSQIVGGATIGNPGAGWTAVLTGDFNGDGH